MIDIQKLLYGLPKENREKLETFFEGFETVLRELVDAQPTIEAKQEIMAEVERMLDEKPN